MMTGSQYFDVCVVCALDEEARAFISVAEKWFDAHFQEGYSPTSGPYRSSTLRNNMNEPITLHVSWLPAMGMVDLALNFNLVLREFRPRFAGMTGICAGDPRKVKLGDLVIADRAFIGDGGKVTQDEDGHPIREYDVSTWHAPKNVLHMARMFDGWRDRVNALDRPRSMHQQRDWLLYQLLYASKMIMRPGREAEEHHDPCPGQTDSRYAEGPLRESGPAPENAAA